MPWKQRKGKPYYYQNQRVGNRVISRYIGTGETAILIAQLDQLDREQRKLERWQAQQARAAFDQLAATPEPVTLLLEQAQRAAAAALEAAGYRQHKRGEWRKQRQNQK